MPSHVSHAPIREGGLVDDCAACEAHAAHPWTLDDENLPALWAKMLAVEYDEAGGYRSKTEARAGKFLYHVALLLERVGTDPRRLIP